MNIHFKTGNKNKARIINIDKVKQSLKSAYSSAADVRLERFIKALLSLHTFTGFDNVCASTDSGETKAFRKMISNIEYVEIFEKLVEEWHLDKEMLEYLEGFVCILYGYYDMKQ